MVRLSRTCYDKPHRCPGWAGGGWKYPKGESRCPSGSIRVRAHMKDLEFQHLEDYPGARPWRFGHCNKCDVITLPVVSKFLDLTWWRVPIKALAARARMERGEW